MSDNIDTNCINIDTQEPQPQTTRTNNALFEAAHTVYIYKILHKRTKVRRLFSLEPLRSVVLRIGLDGISLRLLRSVVLRIACPYK